MTIVPVSPTVSVTMAAALSARARHNPRHARRRSSMMLASLMARAPFAKLPLLCLSAPAHDRKPAHDVEDHDSDEEREENREGHEPHRRAEADQHLTHCYRPQRPAGAAS